MKKSGAPEEIIRGKETVRNASLYCYVNDMRAARDIVKPIVVLVLITLVVSAALAVTYRFTKVEDTGPDLNEINTIGKTVMPEADEFEQMDTEAEGASYLFRAKNGAGIMIQAETTGYNANVPIVFLVGFDQNGAITGLSVTEQQETPGLGDKITQEEFALQFVGKTGEIGFKTGGENSVDGISGATYSSKGMIEGINRARKAFEAVKGELTQ